MKKEIFRKYKYLIQGMLYLLAFLVVWATIDKTLSDNGKGYMIEYDGINQGYAIIGYIQLLVREKVFSSGFDFSVGLGEDNLLVLAFQGAFNPIHWVMAFFFNSLATHILYKKILIVKFFLGGISFLVYANYKKKNMVLSVCTSIIYAFSTWAIGYGVNFIWYYDVLITLPLLIMGIDKIFETENEKSIFSEGWFLCSMVYIGTQGFYFLFWQCLIAGGYFLVKLLWARNHIVKLVFKFSINCLCALLLTAPILFPSIYWFLSSTRNERSELVIRELLPSIGELKTFLRSFLTPTLNAWSHYFLTTIALFGLTVFILSFKKYKFEFCILGLSVFALITPGVGLLFNGGGYLSDRGFYFVWFVLAYCILCGFEEILCLDKKIYLCSVGVVLLYSIIILLAEKEFLAFHAVNLVLFIIIICVVGTCIFEKTGVAKLKEFVTAVLFLCTILLCARNVYFLYDSNNKYEADYAYLRNAQQFVDLELLVQDETKDYNKYIPKEDWYRFESDNLLSWNAGIMKGFFPTLEYWSIVNPQIQKFFEEVEGLEAQNFVGRLYHESNIMKSFLGVRYYEHEGTVNYNDMAMPIVIGFTEYVSEEQIEAWTPEEKEKILLQKIILNKECERNTIYLESVKAYSNEDLQKDVEERRRLLNSSTIISHNKVISEIDMKEDGYVLFTIPYSKGWTAYIDGNEVPILIADYGFIGLEMLNGEHEIELLYRRPFQRLGWIAFSIGLMIVILGVVMNKFKKTSVSFQ